MALPNTNFNGPRMWHTPAQPTPALAEAMSVQQAAPVVEQVYVPAQLDAPIVGEYMPATRGLSYKGRIGGSPIVAETVRVNPGAVVPSVQREVNIGNPYFNHQGAREAYEQYGIPPMMTQRHPYATTAWMTAPGGSVMPLVGFPSVYPHVLNGAYGNYGLPPLMAMMNMGGGSFAGMAHAPILMGGGTAAMGGGRAASSGGSGGRASSGARASSGSRSGGRSTRTARTGTTSGTVHLPVIEAAFRDTFNDSASNALRPEGFPSAFYVANEQIEAEEQFALDRARRDGYLPYTDEGLFDANGVPNEHYAEYQRRYDEIVAPFAARREALIDQYVNDMAAAADAYIAADGTASATPSLSESLAPATPATPEEAALSAQGEEIARQIMAASQPTGGFAEYLRANLTPEDLELYMQDGVIPSDPQIAGILSLLSSAELAAFVNTGQLPSDAELQARAGVGAEAAPAGNRPERRNFLQRLLSRE